MVQHICSGRLRWLIWLVVIHVLLQREEFKKMKEELKTLRKAAVVETGEAARKRMVS